MDPHPKDVRCQNLLGRKPSAEASVWLADQKITRSIGSLGAEASIKYVDGLIAVGAVRVIAIDIRARRARPIPGMDQPSETAQGVIVELPVDKDARNKLFALEAAAATGQGFDPTSDEGQTLMFLKAD